MRRIVANSSNMLEHTDCAQDGEGCGALAKCAGGAGVRITESNICRTTRPALAVARRAHR
jgi:hypothetical protein